MATVHQAHLRRRRRRMGTVAAVPAVAALVIGAGVAVSGLAGEQDRSPGSPVTALAPPSSTINGHRALIGAGDYDDARSALIELAPHRALKVHLPKALDDLSANDFQTFVIGITAGPDVVPVHK